METKRTASDMYCVVGLVILLVCSSGELIGDTRTWYPEGSGNWDDPSNWRPPFVPTLNDTAIVNQGTVFISSGDPAYCWELQMGSLGGSVGRLVIDSPDSSLLLSGGDVTVGMAGEGTFTHAAGLVGPAPGVLGYTICLGEEGGARGVYYLGGGSLCGDTLVIGYSGLGSFVQSGGSWSADFVTVGDRPEGAGVYNICVRWAFRTSGDMGSGVSAGLGTNRERQVRHGAGSTHL